MHDLNLFDQYAESVEHNHNLYTGIEIHGVRYLNDDSVEDQECFVDDKNPQFFSIYARHVDGTCLVCADADMDRIDEIRTLAKDLAVKYCWEYRDFTSDKQCKVSNFTLLPVGTRILSIKGETSDTDSGQDVSTGAHAEGIISDVLPEQAHCYSVDFPKGVSVFLSPQELADSSRYLALGRIIARFQPQAWILDSATDIEGACELDVTHRLLEMSVKDLHLLEEDDYPSDELVHGLTNHVGPHHVEVKDSILEFFGVDKLANITEDMLEQKRLHYAARPSTENGKLYNVHIYAIVRVKVPNVEAENHAEAITKAEDIVDLNGLFNRGSDQEFVDDIDCFLVDEVGDEENYTHSRWYEKDGTTPLGQSSQTLILVNIASGDSGLVLNGKLVLSADPNFEPIGQIVQAANNLATILGIDLKIVNLNLPVQEDWNWDDVLLTLIKPL